MYHVDITNSGDYSFNVKSEGYEFIVDLKGKGITPSARKFLFKKMGSVV